MVIKYLLLQKDTLLYANLLKVNCNNVMHEYLFLSRIFHKKDKLICISNFLNIQKKDHAFLFPSFCSKCICIYIYINDSILQLGIGPDIGGKIISQMQTHIYYNRLPES